MNPNTASRDERVTEPHPPLAASDSTTMEDSLMATASAAVPNRTEHTLPSPPPPTQDLIMTPSLTLLCCSESMMQDESADAVEECTAATLESAVTTANTTTSTTTTTTTAACDTKAAKECTICKSTDGSTVAFTATPKATGEATATNLHTFNHTPTTITTMNAAVAALATSESETNMANAATPIIRNTSTSAASSFTQPNAFVEYTGRPLMSPPPPLLTTTMNATTMSAAATNADGDMLAGKLAQLQRMENVATVWLHRLIQLQHHPFRYHQSPSHVSSSIAAQTATTVTAPHKDSNEANGGRSQQHSRAGSNEKATSPIDNRSTTSSTTSTTPFFAHWYDFCIHTLQSLLSEGGFKSYNAPPAHLFARRLPSHVDLPGLVVTLKHWYTCVLSECHYLQAMQLCRHTSSVNSSVSGGVVSASSSRSSSSSTTATPSHFHHEELGQPTQRNGSSTTGTGSSGTSDPSSSAVTNEEATVATATSPSSASSGHSDSTRTTTAHGLQSQPLGGNRQSTFVQTQVLWESCLHHWLQVDHYAPSPSAAPHHPTTTRPNRSEENSSGRSGNSSTSKPVIATSTRDQNVALWMRQLQTKRVLTPTFSPIKTTATRAAIATATATATALPSASSDTIHTPMYKSDPALPKHPPIAAQPAGAADSATADDKVTAVDSKKPRNVSPTDVTQFPVASQLTAAAAPAAAAATSTSSMGQQQADDGGYLDLDLVDEIIEQEQKTAGMAAAPSGGGSTEHARPTSQRGTLVAWSQPNQGPANDANYRTNVSDSWHGATVDAAATSLPTEVLDLTQDGDHQPLQPHQHAVATNASTAQMVARQTPNQTQASHHVVHPPIMNAAQSKYEGQLRAWIVALYHASRCTFDESKDKIKTRGKRQNVSKDQSVCLLYENCAMYKEIWNHVCRDDPTCTTAAMITHGGGSFLTTTAQAAADANATATTTCPQFGLYCRWAHEALYHYSKCKQATCSICGPVMNYFIPRMKKDLLVAAAGPTPTRAPVAVAAATAHGRGGTAVGAGRDDHVGDSAANVAATNGPPSKKSKYRKSAKASAPPKKLAAQRAKSNEGQSIANTATAAASAGATTTGGNSKSVPLKKRPYSMRSASPQPGPEP